jgi:hypothetical protein
MIEYGPGRELLLLVLLLGGWFVLNRWILPKFGIHT